jgi:hypothetical protein
MRLIGLGVVSALSILLTPGCGDDTSDGEPDSGTGQSDLFEESPAVEDCSNGVDDDGDNLVDCDDPSCGRAAACRTPDERCDNGVDDDEDGDTDCDDSDCARDEACQGPEEICSNGIDDDGDRAADCADTDCSAHPFCQAECGNGEVERGEHCEENDEGACNDNQFCNDVCLCEIFQCGNDLREGTEACDGLDLEECDDNDFCSGACECTEYECGDDRIDGTEECEDSDPDACGDNDFCNAGCHCEEYECGDGSLDGTEVCDAGIDEACGESEYCFACDCTEPAECDDPDDCEGGLVCFEELCQLACPIQAIGGAGGPGYYEIAGVLPGTAGETSGSYDPPESCAEDAEGAGEVTVLFTAPVTGSWLFMAESGGTAHVVLYVLNDCGSNGADATVCAFGENPSVGFDLDEGQSVVLVVDGTTAEDTGESFVVRGGLLDALVLSAVGVVSGRDTDTRVLTFSGSSPSRAPLDGLVVDVYEGGDDPAADDRFVPLTDEQAGFPEADSGFEGFTIDESPGTRYDVRVRDILGNESNIVIVSEVGETPGEEDACVPLFDGRVVPCEEPFVCRRRGALANTCRGARGSAPVIETVTSILHPDSDECEGENPDGAFFTISGTNNEAIFWAGSSITEFLVPLERDNPPGFEVALVYCFADDGLPFGETVVFNVVDEAGRLSAEFEYDVPSDL